MKANELIIIAGPTAIGKTRLAVQLAKDIHGEVISADSRQVYRGMDIGTGKDLAEYKIDEEVIPHHLIDIHEAGYKYNIREFYDDFVLAYCQIREHRKRALLCGGSGLYIETALQENPYALIPENDILRQQLTKLDDQSLSLRLSEIHEEISSFADFSTRQKQIRAIEMDEFLKTQPMPVRETIKVEPIIFVLEMGREKLRANISIRLDQRLKSGLIEEVESLLSSGIRIEDLAYYGLEYKWVTEYLAHKMSYDELVEGLNIAIRQFAKRQMTWFRRMEKQGYQINWIRADQPLERQLFLVHQVLTD